MSEGKVGKERGSEAEVCGESFRNPGQSAAELHCEGWDLSNSSIIL